MYKDCAKEPWFEAYPLTIKLDFNKYSSGSTQQHSNASLTCIKTQFTTKTVICFNILSGSVLSLFKLMSQITNQD